MSKSQASGHPIYAVGAVSIGLTTPADEISNIALRPVANQTAVHASKTISQRYCICSSETNCLRKLVEYTLKDLSDS